MALGWEVTSAGDTSQGGGNPLHSSEAFRHLIWCLDALIALTQEAPKRPEDMGLRCSQPRMAMIDLAETQGGCTAGVSSPLGRRRRHKRFIRHKKSTRDLFPARGIFRMRLLQ